MSADISFAVQAAPADGEGWVSLARRVESMGFEVLSVSDHPGITASPFVALAAVAPVTRSVVLGTAVLNAGVREPLDVASDVASLELLSGGRTLLGLGAGHTPGEWSAIGRSYPSPSDRIARLAEFVPVVRSLLAGEAVNHEGRFFALREARLELAPARPVPLLIGGNSRALVRLGAAEADVVEIGGLGRTLPDGHFHELRWSEREIDQIVATFHEAAGSRQPRLGALVQFVTVTDDAPRVAEAFLASAAQRQPAATLPSIDEVLGTPFVLIGTVVELAQKLLNLRERWGFTRYTIRAGAIDAVGDVMEALRDTGDLAGPN